jgi:hypothetical protein
VDAKSDETGEEEDPVVVLGLRPDGPTFCTLDVDARGEPDR